MRAGTVISPPVHPPFGGRPRTPETTHSKAQHAPGHDGTRCRVDHDPGNGFRTVAGRARRVDQRTRMYWTEPIHEWLRYEVPELEEPASYIMPLPA